jgi:hypothetical protein
MHRQGQRQVNREKKMTNEACDVKQVTQEQWQL